MALLLLAAALVALPVLAQTTILQQAAATPSLSTLAGIVTSPGYEAIASALDDPAATLTLFAPTNDAFAKLPAVPAPELLLQILYYHVIPAVVASGDLAALQFPGSLMSDPTYVNLGAGLPQVLEVAKNGATVTVVFGIPGNVNYTSTVVLADVTSVNGVAHAVDTVLLLPGLASDTATAAGLTHLVEALTIAGLADAVNTATGVTIFAPTNAAFDALGDWRNLPVETLVSVLTYHVVTATAYSTQLRNGQVAYTLQGTGINVAVSDTGVTVNNASVVLANALVQNGVVHVIDQVLLPPTVDASKTLLQNAIATPTLSTLVGIVTSPGYEAVRAALDNPAATLTLFAPTNDAFAKLPAVPAPELLLQILYYHVIPAVVASGDLAALQFPGSLMSDPTYVNLGAGLPQVLEVAKNGATVTVVFGIPGNVNYTSTVVLADVTSVNGVAHAVDTVLLLPGLASDTATAAGLTHLVEALTIAGLADAVNTATGVTIFAPTNAAFDALGDWRNLPVETLVSVLTYHVVTATAYSTGLVDGQQLATLQGETVVVGVSGNGVTVNNASVVLANALVQNGVVHVINQVLVPADVALPPPGEPAASLSAGAIAGIVIGSVVAVALLAFVVVRLRSRGSGSNRTEPSEWKDSSLYQGSGYKSAV